MDIWLEQYNTMVAGLEQWRELLSMSSEGWVFHERYEAVKEVNEEFKRDFAMEQSHGDEEIVSIL